MAKFLDTTGVSYHLQQLINNANEKLVLISPYLRINKNIKLSLEDKNRLKIDIRIIYGKNELQPDENNWLKSLDFVRSSFCENLHAKCYLSEKEAIITSMNLYDFSQVNNNEMGVHVSKEEDTDLYKNVYEETQRLIRISEEIKVSVEKVTVPSEKKGKSVGGTSSPIPRPNLDSGHCIRCNEPIPLDPSHPYCRKCYSPKLKNSDFEYIENHCHICGEPNKSTLEKPAHYECYKANIKLFQ